MAVILVRGSGDVASAVAYVLFGAGHSVLLHDEPKPAHTRRGMSFVDAFFDGLAELENVLGKRMPRLESLPRMLRCRRAIPLTSEPIEQLVSTLSPAVLVDARMRKRQLAESQRDLAPLTIGLGPGFSAGDNVHVAVETQWGDLGKVIRKGPTAPLGGEPRSFAGLARERFVYASEAGVFWTDRRIGGRVREGEVVGRVGLSEVRAPLAGHIRGLTHSEAIVGEGVKVLEIEPRAGVTSWEGIGERPRQVAAGVAKAIEGD